MEKERHCARFRRPGRVSARQRKHAGESALIQFNGEFSKKATAASCRGTDQTAHQTPIVLRRPPIRRPQLGRKTSDAIETSGDGQHLLFGPGIDYRFAEGADFLGVSEPEAGVIEGGLHFDCYSRLDQLERHIFIEFCENCVD